jgi:opacity protein-like surface antigen
MTRIAAAVLAAALVTSAGAQEPAAAAAAPGPVAQPPAVPGPPPPTSLLSGSDGGWLVVARAGTYLPVVGEFNVYRPGLALEAGLGRRLGPVLSLEVSGLYTVTDAGIPVVATVEYGTGLTSRSELTMAGGLATLRATWASGPVELYAGAGLGFYWIQEYQVVEGSFFSGGFLSHDEVVGAHAGAGAQVRVTPSMHLSADLRYTFVEPRLFGRHQRADGIGIGAGIGYRF